MYNEESDEDEQLLKKEHKGMIFHWMATNLVLTRAHREFARLSRALKKSEPDFRLGFYEGRFPNFRKNQRFIRGQDFGFFRWRATKR